MKVSCKKPSCCQLKAGLWSDSSSPYPGSRQLSNLVVFNVNLKSTDIKIAKEIAKKVRGEYGGLTRVKAIGVNLRSRDLVQVSMNLLNYRMSTVVQAYELVKIEARRYGVEIQGSEIIGLVPLECLVDIVGYYLSIPDLKISQVLEYHFIENIDKLTLVLTI